MACLKNHTIVGTITYMTYKLAVTATGKTLRNYGYGWKLHSKVKAGLNPQQVAKELEEKQAARLARPAYRRLFDLLHRSVPQRYRGSVYTALQALGSDADGLWSEINEHMGYEMRDRFTLDDCVELSRAYEAAMSEAKELKAVTA